MCYKQRCRLVAALGVFYLLKNGDCKKEDDSMSYMYDVAISYKSEIQDRAAKIASYLKADGWKVFFAPLKQQEMLSEKIHQTLYDVFKNQSLVKVLLISNSYLEGEWTALEKRMSLESTKDERKRLLIVNYTNQITLPGELRSLQYLDGCAMNEDEIAFLVTERLKKFLHKNPKQNTSKAVPSKAVDDTDEAYGRINVINNKGIIAGDNATFGNIFLGE